MHLIRQLDMFDVEASHPKVEYVVDLSTGARNIGFYDKRPNKDDYYFKFEKQFPITE